jgi:hypothetical protein
MHRPIGSVFCSFWPHTPKAVPRGPQVLKMIGNGHLGLCAVLLLFMSSDGQCYRLPQQEMVLTNVKQLKRIPYIMAFTAVQ